MDRELFARLIKRARIEWPELGVVTDAELEAFVRQEPRCVTECFGRLFRRAIGQDMLGMATGEAMAHLRRLEVEGRAVRETGGDGVWRWRGV